MSCFCTIVNCHNSWMTLTKLGPIFKPNLVQNEVNRIKEPFSFCALVLLHVYSSLRGAPTTSHLRLSNSLQLYSNPILTHQMWIVKTFHCPTISCSLSPSLLLSFLKSKSLKKKAKATPELTHYMQKLAGNY